MKIAVDIGHNCPPDTGAVGVRRECDLVREVGEKLIQLLTVEGHEIIRCLPKKATSVSNSLIQRVAIANSSDADLFISIHFNAFNGKARGTECFAISPVGRAYASKIVNEIASLGFINRGVKDGSRLYVVRETSMPAILVECCFCDSREDMSIFDAAKMATAIRAGLD